MTNSNTPAIKSIGFLAFFFLLFFGMQHVHVPALGGAGTPIAAIIITVVALIVLARLIKTDGESFDDIGLGWSADVPKHFVLGTVLGLVVVGVMMTAVLLLTSVEIQIAPDSNILSVLAISLGILFVLALMEEVVFRSYPLFKLRESWGIRPAIYITSIAFAFYHGFVFESLLGPGVWGLFYGWMALKTNNIALPTGFHLGLNWMQALLGMKPQYGDSIWELTIGEKSGLLDVEVLGLIMQLILLVIGVVMVEKLIASKKHAGH